MPSMPAAAPLVMASPAGSTGAQEYKLVYLQCTVGKDVCTLYSIRVADEVAK
jgi:hypothetical protein